MIEPTQSFVLGAETSLGGISVPALKFGVLETRYLAPVRGGR